MSAQNVIKENEQRMQKSLEAVKNELSKLRTGRASASILDGIKVDYYGTPTALNQVANVAIPEPRVITITPWDKGQLSAIEKALLASDIGMTPSNDGNIIRLKVPELTQDRRNELVKMAKKIGEDGKIAIRNVRRDANEGIKKLEKNSEISKDDEKKFLDQIQVSTDKIIAAVDQTILAKEKELLDK
jgi:ribosome recycling factor